MCSRGQVLSVLCCLVLATAVPVSADLAWEYIYEGETLPDDVSLGNDAWQLMGDNQFAEVTGQSELHIGDVGQNHCFFLYNVGDAALMEDATVEARVKVLSQSGAANFEVLVGMQDGSNSKWLDLFPDHILLDSSSVTYDVDMTEYHILRMVRNGAEIRIYVDDEEVMSETHQGAGESWIGFIFGAGCTACRSEQFWDYLVFTTEGGFSPQELPSYASLRRPAELAGDPSPDNDANDVPRDVTLSWTPGEFAVTHDVYLGTSFEDVNAATPGTLVSQGQAAGQYAPETVLEFGRTYYWRVDEVNGAPDNTIFKGEVWNFTVEPLAYAIDNVVATSNGASNAGAGPENTVNGSGLNANDEHSVAATDMWLAAEGAEPLWLQCEFDQVYKLHEMVVWNYNVQFERILGFGLKDVTIDYSTDGVEWMTLGDAVFAQATAQSTYEANTTVAFNGVAARYVRITVHSGYGMMGQYGLSEVRFMYIPATAREPEPADGATNVSVNTDLTWRAGRDAVSHEVYFGTDPEALPLVDTVSGTSYTPGALDLATTYYWQLTALQEAESWAGAVWDFATQDYLVVDDFESYDDEDNRIYDSWLDGWVNETGSTVGYLEEPFAEQTIVHGGGQSMPLFYDNTDVATSEADFELSQNWTLHGIQSLSLYFYGDPTNTGGRLYVKINGARVDYDGSAADLSSPNWHRWNIDLSTADDVSSVTSLTIGIEGAGASGILYIDDILLYP